jgi:NADPH:quinone reductase-like Zn-dependent oxidoreductase
VKAIIYTIYGSPNVLQRKKTEKALPNNNEVFIKVYASSANAADWRLLRGAPPDYRKGRGQLNSETDRFGSVSFV